MVSPALPPPPQALRGAASCFADWGRGVSASLACRLTTAAVILLAVAGLTVAACSATGHPSADQAGAAAPRIVTVQANGRSHAELDVMSGADSVTVVSAPLGGRLLRAAALPGAGPRPRLVISGNTVQLYLESARTRQATVRVTLSSAVAWRLVFSGGASQTSVFLGHGVLRGAAFTAGSSRITLRLPRPHGTVPVVLAGGASLVTLAAPRGVPVRLSLDGGASSVLLAGRHYTGLAGGTVLAAPGWATAASRYDVQAPAGISQVTVGTW